MPTDDLVAPSGDARRPARDRRPAHPGPRGGVPRDAARHPPADHEARAWVGGLGPVEASTSGWPSSRATLAGYARSSTASGSTTSTSSPAAQGTGVGSRAAGPGQGAAARPASACGSSSPTSRPARSTARRGLVDLERTDGAANEEKAPDIRMAWPGADPLAFYRSPDRLGRPRPRRAAQPPRRPHRAPSSRTRTTPERDLDREREIARALALRAPALGEERLYRIVHQIISESLDAGGSPSSDAATRPKLGTVGGACHHRARRVVG